MSRSGAVRRFFGGLAYDVRFVRGHRLQPGWYKALKVVLLVAVVGAYLVLFGPARTAVFVVVFLALSLALHLVYRAGTRKFTTTWLDFRVEERDGTITSVSIGKVYYSAIAVFALIAVALSQFVGFE
jgi:hypothetical protein